VEPTSRDDLPYTEADVRAATARLRDICAGLPEVTERLSHGAVTFFVRARRTVCYLTDDHHGDGRLALVCPARAGVQEEVVGSDPERFFRPPYVGHRGWIGLRLDIDPDWDEVAAIVEDAYRCVAPVTLVRRLDAAPSPGDSARLHHGPAAGRNAEETAVAPCVGNPAGAAAVYVAAATRRRVPLAWCAVTAPLEGTREGSSDGQANAPTVALSDRGRAAHAVVRVDGSAGRGGTGNAPDDRTARRPVVGDTA
jgi:hypothetical protein